MSPTGFDPAIESAVLSPTHVPSGDWQDDDGEVLDSLYQETPEPPSPESLPLSNHPQRTAAPVAFDRLITENRSYSNLLGAVMLLPADPNRKSLRVLRVDSVTTLETSPVFLASSKTAVDGGPSQFGAALLPGVHLSDAAWIVLDGYTGPLWVSGDATAAAYTYHVSVLAVTQ